jgi:hypothetical protein
MDWLCDFLCFWGKCVLLACDAFDHGLLVFELIVLGVWWWFDYRNKTKESVAKKREAKIKIRFRLVCLLVLPIYILIVAPFIQYHEANEAKVRAEIALATKPTPVKTRLLNLAALLRQRAGAWDKGKAAAIKMGLIAYGLNNFDAEYLGSIMDACKDKILSAKNDLVDHGKWAPLLNELTSNSRISAPYGNIQTSADLRKLADEIQRLAEDLDD